MRNVPCALAFVVLLCSGLAISQNTPSWELSGGYQFTRADIGAVQDSADRLTVPVGLPRIDVGRKLNMSGGNAAIENNVNSWVGGVFDFGGAYGDKHIDLSTVAQAAGLVPPGTHVQAIFRPTIFTYTGGPQFHYRKHEHIQPFARILAGAAHSDLGPDSPTKATLNILAPAFKTTSTSFALIAGLGVDYVWKQHVAFRVSGDYLRTWLFDEHQGNIRMMAGVDFRFGSTK